MVIPSNAKIHIAESGARITTFGNEQCAVELNDNSAALYKLDENAEGVYLLTSVLRGEMPDKITFQDMQLNGEKIETTYRINKQLRMADCFKGYKNLLGKPLSIAKKLLQEYGTVFDISQETRPEIIENGIRYGISLQDENNENTVIAYADEEGNVDSVQFIVSSESSGEIIDKLFDISDIETSNRKASEFSFKENNRFFNNTQEFVDVLYLKDGTLTVKYDINLNNYVIFELRSYNSMNQGFHGAFKTDLENVYVDNLLQNAEVENIENVE